MQLHNDAQEKALLATTSASKNLRTELRARMLKRIEELGLDSKDAAVGLELEVRVKAVRPWGGS